MSSITLVSASLHWLPVDFRIDFKSILMIFKVRPGLTLSFMSEIDSGYVLVQGLHPSEDAAYAVHRGTSDGRVNRC